MWKKEIQVRNQRIRMIGKKQKYVDYINEQKLYEDFIENDFMEYYSSSLEKPLNSKKVICPNATKRKFRDQSKPKNLPKPIAKLRQRLISQIFRNSLTNPRFKTKNQIIQEISKNLKL